MTNVFNLEIAGIALALECQGSITIQSFDQAYSSFLIPHKDQPDINIELFLNLNNMPDSKYLKIKFDTNQSWSMFQQEDDSIIMFNAPAINDKPFLITRFDSAFRNVRVYVGDTYINKHNGKDIVSNPVQYPLDQILLMYYLAQREGTLIHAAGLCFHDRGYIFPGKSGAGKSTISRQLAEVDNCEFLSDDRMIIRKINNTFKAFGTPWPGEAGIAVNKSVQLSGIFFISQASFNKIEEIKPQKVLERLLPVASIPWYDKEVMIKILDFCEDIISNVPVYEFFFKPDNEVVDVFETFVAKH